MTAEITDIRKARADVLQDEARKLWRQADALRNLADMTDQRGVELDNEAYELLGGYGSWVTPTEDPA